MFGRSAKFKIETDRLILRTPRHNDFRNWVELRTSSRDFLTPWDPVWSSEHLTRKSFTNRVYWAQRAVKAGSGYPLFLIHKIDKNLVGAVTLDNIRRGPSQVGTLGYWIGQPYARQGFMREAVGVVVKHAFQNFDISRIEAACLPENQPSRGLLEGCGFKYEGVAQSYLQIGGRWRTHVPYAFIRHDRRGKTLTG